jgi:hypothetical protein
MMAVTASTAAAMEGNSQTAAEVASGTACSRSVSSEVARGPARVGGGGKGAAAGGRGAEPSLPPRATTAPPAPLTCDDAQRALCADHEVCQVVACRGLARARAEARDAAVGEDHRQPQHLLALRWPWGGVGGWSADGQRTGRARGCGATARRAAPGFPPPPPAAPSCRSARRWCRSRASMPYRPASRRHPGRRGSAAPGGGVRGGGQGWGGWDGCGDRGQGVRSKGAASAGPAACPLQARGRRPAPHRVPQLRVELLPRHARLHAAVHVGGVDLWGRGPGGAARPPPWIASGRAAACCSGTTSLLLAARVSCIGPALPCHPAQPPPSPPMPPLRAPTCRTLFMWVRSRHTEPAASADTWPSMLVPAPNGTTGVPVSAAGGGAGRAGVGRAGRHQPLPTCLLPAPQS